MSPKKIVEVRDKWVKVRVTMDSGAAGHVIPAVEGDKESNGLIENAVIALRGIIRTIKYHIESRTQEPFSDDSPVIPWLVEHGGCILSRCQKGRDGRTPFERLHGKKPTQEFVPFGEKVLARQITTDLRCLIHMLFCVHVD